MLWKFLVKWYLLVWTNSRFKLFEKIGLNKYKNGAVHKYIQIEREIQLSALSSEANVMDGRWLYNKMIICIHILLSHLCSSFAPTALFQLCSDKKERIVHIIFKGCTSRKGRIHKWECASREQTSHLLPILDYNIFPIYKFDQNQKSSQGWCWNICKFLLANPNCLLTSRYKMHLCSLYPCGHERKVFKSNKF